MLVINPKNITAMVSEKFYFKDREYNINTSDQDQLTINEKLIEVVRSDDGKLWTPNLPYQSFDNLEELAKQIIISFPTLKTL